jgi:hypothetical protein
MAAFKAAVQSGLRPGEFWELTPYIARLSVAALRDGKTSELWMAAALARQKKLPKLETLLTEKPQAAGGASEERLKLALKQMGPKKHG